ncbi:hypothetical protein, partial [Burkholderia sp. SIMBA_019]|uniref:hypothetical protein n=1 Tax=Burkholderia sp. SIMBA_019 TaxID=3085765 RepID=UPI00397B3075
MLDAYRGIEAASRPSGWFRATDSLIVPTKHTRDTFTIENVLPWLVAAWLVGVAAMSCRLTAGLLWVRR